MKDKFLVFIIGLLLGAVISTGAFYVYTKTNNTNTSNSTSMGMPGGTPPSMPNGQNGEQGEPPAKPGEATTDSSN